MKTVLLINGPNLNMLGQRQPEIYGHKTLDDIESEVIACAEEMGGITVLPFQSNHEGAIIDFIQTRYADADGIIINPGALTHYGYSLRDCLAGINLPIVEVHISNIQKREEWRKKSVISEVCIGQICGLGTEGYLVALRQLTDK